MNWEALIKQARDCHTKQAWTLFFEEHGAAIASTSNAKPLHEIFKALKADPQSLQYDPRIWVQLIHGCLSSWNLELGREIAEFAKKVPSPHITIAAAQIYLESGLPAMTRETANRGLRLTGLAQAEKLQLEMLVCSSYAEEGKRAKTIRLLNKMRAAMEAPSLAMKDRAEILTNMGRLQFHLGRYMQAAEVFYKVSRLYRDLKEWEAAAKAIFNTAVCYLNGDTKHQEEAFVMIEECRKLAETSNLPGPLSHCHAAYGLAAYQKGDFSGAVTHFRQALAYLPSADKGFRSLHILSMLSYTYLAMGRYHLARKFAQQTLNLAERDESDRFKVRYKTLKAMIIWEDGHIEESQALLRSAILPLETHGIHKLEELSTLSHYQINSALLNDRQAVDKFHIDESLKKNTHNWVEMTFSIGQLLLNQDNFTGAEERFTECLEKSRQIGDLFHEARGLLGMIQSRLRQKRPQDLDEMSRDFSALMERLGETPLKSQVQFIEAARAYQSGEFAECERLLRFAAKAPRLNFADRFILSAWIATIEGRSSRLTSEWQQAMLARYTRTYFAPTFVALDERHFQVSDRYTISLERHPSLAELLHYLLIKSNFSATTAEIQVNVWKQSLQSQGWQQKIRNTIMRLRDFFPYTMAPIILHQDSIFLFKDAIKIQAPRREGLKPEDEILRLLQNGSMSSTELSHRLKISAATTKRILKRLSDESMIKSTKQGRNVFYDATPSSAPH